jgi:poly(A) polymerase
VLYRLRGAGYKAYLVGGSVRDLLLSRVPKDFDIGTDAVPQALRRLFRNCRMIGRRFRLAHILFPNGKVVEVATFRRRPELEGEGQQELLQTSDNTFGSPREDALRRDFTINGLFYDISDFSVVDYVGGLEDLEAGLIRTIGDPDVRFR